MPRKWNRSIVELTSYKISKLWWGLHLIKSSVLIAAYILHEELFDWGGLNLGSITIDRSRPLEYTELLQYVSWIFVQDSMLWKFYEEGVKKIDGTMLAKLWPLDWKELYWKKLNTIATVSIAHTYQSLTSWTSYLVNTTKLKLKLNKRELAARKARTSVQREEKQTITNKR